MFRSLQRLFWFLLLAGHSAVTSGADGALTVSEILDRMVKRAAEISRQTNAPIYVFDKLARIETLNSDGEVKRSKEKLYRVTVINGMTRNQLVAVDGRALASQESDILSDTERRWRDKYSTGPGQSPADRMEDLVNEGLISRFEFTLDSEEEVRNRSCYVLVFKPRTEGLPDGRLIDRVINLLHGRVWVDKTDFEIVKADVRTEGTMRLWGGLLGTLHSFQLHLDRERSPDGHWFNRLTEVNAHGRRLFSTFRMRLREFGSDFRPVGAPAGKHESDVAALPR